MKKITEHSKQLRTMYKTQDDRLVGSGEWKQFPLFWFLLFMSYECTRRCPNCYSFNQVGDGKHEEMSEETFSRLLEWIPEVYHLNNVKVNVIVFLGGEPLLRTDRIKRVMDACYEKTPGIQGNVYTNGDVIDKVNWDDLEDIQWMTTNITDISLPELSRRMKIIEERSNVINQTIVATLDDPGNLNRVEEITIQGLEEGYRLRFYRNLFRGLDVDYKKKLLKKYHTVCDILEQYLIKGYDVHTTFLFDTLIPGWNLESSPYHCGKRIATIYPDGSVGPCLRNHRYKTGTIWNQDPLFLVRENKFEMNYHRDDLPEDCRICESRDTCQGGCPNDRLLLTGTVKGKSVMCDVHKEIIPRLKDIENRQKTKTK